MNTRLCEFQNKIFLIYIATYLKKCVHICCDDDDDDDDDDE